MYICNFCKERFHVKRCPSCGREDYSEYNTQKKKTYEEEIISFIDEYDSGKRKAFFLCQDCGKSFESNIDKNIFCIGCKSSNCEIKSPIVRVDDRDRDFSIVEKKFIKFVKNLMGKKIELEECVDNLIRLLKACEASPDRIVQTQKIIYSVINSIEKHHSKKISEYRKRIE